MAETMTEPAADSVDTAVADPPVADSPATDDDLEALLREFEIGTSQPADQANQPDYATETAAERDRAFAENLRAHTENLQLDYKRQELEQAQEYLRAQEDVHDEIEAFKAIRGELDVTDEDLQGFIIGRALKDESINRVWANRRDDRAAFNRMVARLRGDLQQHEDQRRQKILSREATVDHHAVAQAVRGASERVAAEPAPDFARMSDRELQKWKDENMK